MSSNIKRKVIKDTDRWKARLEEVKQNDKKILFIHIELKGNVDVPLIRELREEWEGFKRKIKAAGYDNIYSYSATPKFYSMFKGYEDIGPLVYEGLEGYRVLKWDLK
jgi:hypothetical protein